MSRRERLVQLLSRGRGRLAAVIVLAILLGLQIAVGGSLFGGLGLALFDLYARLMPRVRTTAPVVIVAVDEPSLKAIGQWPWPRQIVAQLVDKILAGHPVALGIDMIWPEPDRLSPQHWVQQEGDLAPAMIQALTALPDHDELLRGALASGPVAIGIGAQAAGLPDHPGPLPPLRVTGIHPRDLATLLPSLGTTLRSIPDLDRAAKGHGLMSADRDIDGMIRRVPLIGSVGGHLAPSLGLEILRLAVGAQWIGIKVEGDRIVGVAPGPLPIATQADGTVWLHLSRHDPQRFVSASDVLDGKAPADLFDQRLVLLGVTGLGLVDQLITPLGPMPGVEIHAQLLENVFEGRLAERPRWTQWAEPALTAAFGLLLILLLPALRLRWFFPVGILTLVALGGLGVVAWAWALWLVDVATPAAAGGLVFVALLAGSLAETASQRARLQRSFGLFLAPSILDRILAADRPPELGGEMRNVTLFFSDIVGFTALSEKLPPSELVSVMNEYLSEMTEIIDSEGGLVDKYIGDAIVAVFGVPLDDDKHALHAVRAALACQARLSALNVASKKLRGLGLKARIGIATGEALVGNVGSRRRFSYTAMGDTVNLASRLEGANKFYGTSILVSEQTRINAGDAIAWREIDSVRVVGREATVRLFQPHGLTGATSAEVLALTESFSRGIAAYRARRFAEAAAIFEPLAEADQLAGLYLEWSRRYSAEPPPESWDAVTVLDHK